MDPFENRGDLDGKTPGLMAMAHRQHPGLFGKVLPIGNDGQPQANSGVWNITDEMRQAVGVLACKLAKGIYYRDVQAIFPNDGCLVLTWFTNTDLMQHGKYPIFEILKHIAGDAPKPVRSGKFLNDQFEYKFSLSPQNHLLGLQARFGTAFGLVVSGSTTPGLLEKFVQQVMADSPRCDGVAPFTILQSRTIPTGRALP
jgi:hypothetical protein